jgi:LCP family protein required for cell wall assembly
MPAIARLKHLSRFSPISGGSLSSTNKAMPSQATKYPLIQGRRKRPRRTWWRRGIGTLVLLCVLAIGGWFGGSAAIFLVNAKRAPAEPAQVKQALSPGGGVLSPSTILVLGSDLRGNNGGEPGTEPPSRSDSMMLVHASPGNVRRLSILRDSYAAIPGHAPQKINAAYAYGGPALSAQAVQGFMGNGLRINHVVEFNFDSFPELIDAVGGIDINLNQCVQSQPFQGRVVSLGPGLHHLNGDEALAFSRVRHNRCNPLEDDRARVARQQSVLAALQAKLSSPSTMTRLPWISAKAPNTIRTDMSGVQLLSLATDMATAGSGQTEVLQPYDPGGGPGDSALVSPSARQQAVQRLIGPSNPRA